MTIKIVNGYTCETGCEVAKARTGQDPHPTRHDAIDGKGGMDTSGASAFDRPAVIFGGSLTQFSPVTAVAPAGNVSDPSQVATRPFGNAVDRLI